MTGFLILLCEFISGCAYLIRGGSPLFTGKEVAHARYVGCGLATFAFAALIALYPVVDILKTLILIPIFGAGWFFMIVWAWQGYYSIGQSTDPRRNSISWIDFLLNKIFGYQWLTLTQIQALNPRLSGDFGVVTLQVGKESYTFQQGVTIRSQKWRVRRDATGMFLRMMYSLPLFLTLGLVISPTWGVGLLAVIFSALFSIIVVSLYAAYNWILNRCPKFNYSEFFTGYMHFGLTAIYIDLIKHFMK